MRPVSEQYPDSQQFGEGATQGVVANSDPNSGMGYYVYLYGNYQPFGHAGKDIACPIGTPIRAIADGTVLYAGWTEDLPGSGNIRKWLFYYNFGGIITVIQHDGWISAVAHQSSNDAVTVGQRVSEGQIIGLSGNTKTRTTTVAPHVHTEALVYMDYRTDARNGIVYGRVDPQQFFGGIAAQGSITTEEGFLMALSEDEQRRILAAADRINYVIDDPQAKVLTTNHLPAVGAAVLHTEVEWMGFDGKTQPAGQRHTTTQALALGWSDAIATSQANLTNSVKAAGAAVDVTALAAQLAPLLNTATADQLLSKIKEQWTK